MKKSLLLVGDGNHQFIQYLSKYLKKKYNYEIHLLSLSESKGVNDHFEQVFFCGSKYNKSKLGSLIMLWKLSFFLIKNANKYSTISIQFVRPIYYFLFRLNILNRSQNTIVSVWGSDVLSCKIDKPKISYILNSTRIVTCATSKVKNKVQLLAPNQKRVSFVKYGLEPLEYIKDLSDAFDICKNKLGIEQGKTLVTIGHNASENNQHIECLKAINHSIPVKGLDEFVFAFPLTYGREASYVEKLKCYLQKSNLNFIIFEEYMTDLMVARLRKATDIYVNLQVTDMLSGAMQEHIYAGNQVITGKWLAYQELKDIGANFHEVYSIEELPSLIIQCKKNLNEKKMQDAIYCLSSWNKVIDGWENVFSN